MVAAFGGMRIHPCARIRISPALSVAAGAWRRKGTPHLSRAGMGCLLPLSSSYSSSKAVALVAGHQGRGPVVPRIAKVSSIRQIAGLCAELGKARLRCVGRLMFVPKSRRLVYKRGERILLSGSIKFERRGLRDGTAGVRGSPLLTPMLP